MSSENKQFRGYDAGKHFHQAKATKLSITTSKLNCILKKACVWQRQGLYPKAVVEFKLATRANPDHAEARVELGLTYHQMGQLHKAIKTYLSALEVRPNFIIAYTNLGAAYDELGQFVNALKVYTRAIVIGPAGSGIAQ